MTGVPRKNKLRGPVIDGMFRVPVRLLEGRTDLAKLKKKLTAKYYDVETGVTTPVPIYRTDVNVISLPRTFAKTEFPDLWAQAEDRTIPCNDNEALPIRIEPRDDKQLDFVYELIDALYDGDRTTDIQAVAPTGSGKTASACIMHAYSGVGPMLVVVHTNRLKNGWLGSEELKKGLRFFYGDEWVDENVGIVQQDVCDYAGKKIVIAMAPSLCSRRYPDAFYRYFPLVVIDEIHKMATPVLNNVLCMFPAQAHVTLTATPRKGEMKKVIDYHVGEPSVISTQETLKPKVCIVELEQRFDFRNDDNEPIDNKNSLVTFMSRNKMRQALLADIIFYRGYGRGRQCLVLSDRTDQLLDFQRRLTDMGVPPQEIGLYVGSHNTGKTKLTGYLEHPPTGRKLHFRGLSGFENRGKAQTYVKKKIGDFANSLGVREGSIVDASKYARERAKPSDEDYDRIERVSTIVLATYGIFDTGIDIRRLDWGLEASMRGDVAQAVGRILRLDKDKALPEWYSVFDKLWTILEREIFGKIETKRYNHHTPKRLEKQRRDSYAKQNAHVVRIKNPHEAIEKAKAAYQASSRRAA